MLIHVSSFKATLNACCVHVISQEPWCPSRAPMERTLTQTKEACRTRESVCPALRGTSAGTQWQRWETWVKIEDLRLAWLTLIKDLTWLRLNSKGLDFFFKLNICIFFSTFFLDYVRKCILFWNMIGWFLQCNARYTIRKPTLVNRSTRAAVVEAARPRTIKFRFKDYVVCRWRSEEESEVHLLLVHAPRRNGVTLLKREVSSEVRSL